MPPLPDPQREPAAWDRLLAELRAIPAENSAWTELPDLLRELERLGREKLGERDERLRRVADSVSAFRSQWEAAIPGLPALGCCLSWSHAELGIADVDAALGEIRELSATLEERKELLVELGTAAHALAAGTGSASVDPLYARLGALNADIVERARTVSARLAGPKASGPQSLEPPAPVPPPADHKPADDARQEAIPDAGECSPPEAQPSGGATGDVAAASPAGETRTGAGDEAAAPDHERGPEAAPAQSGEAEGNAVGRGVQVTGTAAALAPEAEEAAVGSVEPKEVVEDFEATDAATPTELAPEIELTAPSRPLGSAVEPIPDDLPTPLVSYVRFAEAFWIDGTGRCGPAPWCEKAFAGRLREAAAAALEARDFGRLWIYAEAERRLGGQPLVDPHDVEACARIWSSPGSPAVGLDLERPKRLLRDAIDGQSRAATVLGATLEALRPTHASPLGPEEIDLVGDTFGAAAPDLRELIVTLLRMNALGQAPVSRLRAALDGAVECSPEDLAKALVARRAEFRELVRQKWSAAGGRLELSHCREAWRRFIDQEIRPLKTVLADAPAEAVDGWDVDALKKQVLAVPANYHNIAEGGGVKYEERVTADHGMAEIVDAALRVVEAAERVRRPARKTAKIDHIPVDLAARVCAAAPIGAPDLDLARELLARELKGAGEASELDALALEFREACRHPGLLPLIAGPGTSRLSATDRVPVDAFTDPVRAAAALLGEPLLAERESDRPDVIRTTWSKLAERGRTDLMQYLMGRDGLNGHEKNQIRREEAERSVEVYTKAGDLAALWRDADELNLWFAPVLGQVVRHAEARLDEDDSVHRELQLFEGWVLELTRRVRDEVGIAVESLRAQAARLEVDKQHAILRALEERHYGRAQELAMRRRSVKHLDQPLFARATLWRSVARERFPDRDRVRLLRAAPKTPEAERLAAQWLDSAGTDAAAQRLRMRFCDYLCGEPAKKGSPASSLRDVLVSGTKSTSVGALRIDLGLLRRRLVEDQKHRQTFMPQLLDYDEMLVVNAPTDTSGVITHPTAVVNVARAASGGDRNLVVVLAPGLSDAMRRDALKDLRRDAVRAAIVDDLDLCRLLIPDAAGRQPHGFLGLLEIVFEQVDWSLTNPFEATEGQYMKTEMFVGRRDEAARLAQSTVYSRIFSGRRMGKSALLKFVQETYGGRPLPSGKVLEVIYLVAAGSQPEHVVVDSIHAELGARGLVRSAPERLPEDPGMRLEALMSEFVTANPSKSLLVILDEADQFVHDQIELYRTKLEGCLSFRMIKSLPGQLDSRHLPRVRFLFSGYRMTNANQGAWPSGTSCLVLPPLREDDAAQLIEGPLARLGVDVSAHARYIARGCGFLPAVILKYGEVLFRRVRESRPGHLREDVVVSRDEVAAAFSDDSVLDEIVFLVRNNFVGDPVGEIVFCAALLAFSELPYFQPLEDAALRVLDQIQRVDPDTEWLRRVDPRETGEIGRKLEDFVERQLLVSAGAEGRVAYRLRFPRLVPIFLSRLDITATLADLIRTVREGGQPLSDVAGILPPSAMDLLRRATSTRPDPEAPVAAAVVGAHWLDAVQGPKGGLPVQLGFERRVIDLARTHDPMSVAVANPLCGINVGRAEAEAIVAARPRELPAALLLGGVDLLRWACGADSVGYLVDAHGLGRLSTRRLAWWFERVRAFQFANPDAIVRIAAETGGVPILVREVAAALGPEPGREVSAAALKEALGRARAAVESVARELVEGTESVRLSAREIELLRMIALVARATPGPVVLREALGEEWNILYRERMPEAEPLDALADDSVSLAVLSHTGLLPTDARGTLHLATDDVLFAVAERLPTP